MNFIWTKLVSRFLMDEVSGYGDAGGNSGGTKGETGQPQHTPPAQKEETPGAQYDEHGYEIEPAKPGEEPAPSQKPPEEPAKPEGTSGYGAEPKGTGEAPKDVKPDETKPDQPTDDIKIEDTGELLENEISSIKDVAKKYKLSAEAVKALVEIKKAEVAEIKKVLANNETTMKQKTLEIRKSWFDELKNDPVYGRENFDKNTLGAEKVLKEHFPYLTKELTGKGRMLPPYVMKDLASLANHLYSTPKFRDGKPTMPETSQAEGDKNDPLAYYE